MARFAIAPLAIAKVSPVEDMGNREFQVIIVLNGGGAIQKPFTTRSGEGGAKARTRAELFRQFILAAVSCGHLLTRAGIEHLYRAAQHTDLQSSPT